MLAGLEWKYIVCDAGLFFIVDDQLRTFTKMTLAPQGPLVICGGSNVHSGRWEARQSFRP